MQYANEMLLYIVWINACRAAHFYEAMSNEELRQGIVSIATGELNVNLQELAGDANKVLKGLRLMICNKVSLEMVIHQRKERPGNPEHHNRLLAGDATVIGEIALAERAQCLKRNARAALVTYEQSVGHHLLVGHVLPDRAMISKIGSKVYDNYGRRSSKIDNLIRRSKRLSQMRVEFGIAVLSSERICTFFMDLANKHFQRILEILKDLDIDFQWKTLSQQAAQPPTELEKTLAEAVE